VIVPAGYEPADDGKVIVLASERARVHALGLDRVETALAAGTVLRATPYKAIARVGQLFVKRYDYDRRTVFVKAALKANFPVFSGPIELANALALARAGIPVPRPLAAGEETRGWRRRSFVALEAVPGVALERVTPPAPAARRALVRSVARLARALHDAGFWHRDLYLANVFQDGERLTLLDLERVLWRKSGPPARAIRKDLAALDYSAKQWSATDRVRFLHEYLRTQALDAASKSLARRIRRKARTLARKGSKG
jgi:heptose I phosphotransferase